MPLLSVSALVSAPSNQRLVDEVLSFTSNEVKCIDPQLKRQEAFSFHHVFNDVDDFNSSAYASQVYPLVQKTVEGESTMAVICGPASLDVRSHVLPPDGGMYRGLLSAAAGDLITAAQRSGSGNTAGSVTFSWFKIDTSSSEGITDILKNASGAPGVARAHTAPAFSASATPSSSSSSSLSSQPPPCDMSLLVREIGRGRGMFVPGLWEVEISNGADVDAVVSHVTQVLRSADHSKGLHHTAFCLTYKPAHLSIRGGSSSASKGSYLVAGGSNDPPGLGRLTFLLLSNIGVSQQLGTFAPSPCFEHLNTALKWVTQRRASPPFHKSRVTLMLRDIICARQHSAWLLFLPSTSDELEANYHWLRLLNLVEAAAAASGLGGSAVGGGAGGDVGMVSFSSSQREKAGLTSWQGYASSPTPVKGLRMGEPMPGSPASSQHSGSSYTRPRSETEQVLAVQLEAARAELSSVSAALASTRTELQHVQKSWAELNAHIDTNGSSLKKRDAEAFRKAQADVKDYDIYRQVMEAAMVRLQAELETIHAENKTLRAERDKGFATSKSFTRAQEEEHKAAVKGYTATKKVLKETDEKLAAAAAQVKRLTKERDAAKAVVLDSHHSSAIVKTLEEDMAALRREADNLKKKVASGVANERKLAADVEEARQAQRRALARIIELQDEMHRGTALRPAGGQSVKSSRAPSPSPHNLRPASPSGRLRESVSQDSLTEPSRRAPSPARSRSPSPGRFGARAGTGGSSKSSLQQAIQSVQSGQRPVVRSRLGTTINPPPPPHSFESFKSASAPGSPRTQGGRDGLGSPAPAPNAPPPVASANTARRFHPSSSSRSIRSEDAKSQQFW